MKRWVSGAMAFIITFSCAQGSFAHASGDVDDAAASALMAQGPEDAPDGDVDEEILIAAPLSEAEDGTQSAPEECELTLGEDDETAEAEETAEIAEIVQVADDESANGVIPDAEAEDVTNDTEGATIDATADTEDTVIDATAEVTDEATEPVGDVTEEVTEPAGDASDEATEPVENATEEVTEPVENAAEEVTEPAENAAEEVTELAENAAEPAENAADDVTGDAANVEEAPEADDTAEADAPKDEAAEADAQKDEAAEVDAPKDEAAEADAPKDEATDVDAQKDEANEADAPKSEVPAAEAAQADAGAAETAATAQTDAATAQTDAATAQTDAATAQAEATEPAETAQTDAGTTETAATGESTAEAAFQLNMTECALGLKETYRGLSTTGGSGSVTWASSNRKIVKVDANTGVIKGLKKGKATVTATCGGATASVLVTVKNAPKKVAFKPKKLSLGAGTGPVPLKLKLGKGAASAGTVYASSNDAVASVDANGILTAKSEGTAVITALTYNKKKATCKVSVYATPAPASIALPAQFIIGAKESRGALPLTMVSETGEQNCVASVTWKSTNKKVVRVDPGTGALYAVRTGAATIVAKTSNGLRARCRVKVKKAPKKVTLSASGKSIEVGGTMQYSVRLSKGSAGTFSYASSNTGVATIDETGLAKGVGAGTTTITVTTYNGKTASATLTVTAKPETTPQKPDVKVPESMEKLGIASYQNVYSADLNNEQKLEHVIYNAQNQLGKKYTYGGGYSGGEDPAGFDCSGLVYWCFGKIKVKLEDSAYKQGYDKTYTKVARIDELKRGDVVCFNTDQDESDKNDLSDHTGIYLGKGYFIHASSAGQKVIVSQFETKNSDYYKRNFSWGRRILQ